MLTPEAFRVRKFYQVKKDNNLKHELQIIFVVQFFIQEIGSYRKLIRMIM